MTRPSANIAPLAMLFGSLFLLFYGGGGFGVDERLQRRGSAGAVPVAERGVPIS